MAALCLIPILIFGDWDYKQHDISDVRCWISNFAILAHDNMSGAGLEWRQGSGHLYVYGAGVWFGSILTGNDTCVSVGYNPNSGSGEWVCGLIRQDTSAYNNPYVRIYMYPEDWPPDPDSFPMAPQGHRTEEESWCCFNENDPTYHITGDTHPIGIEVYQSGYTDPDCPDAIFFKNIVKNCTTYTIANSYIGICLDYDIGDAGDDMYGLTYQKWFPQGSDSFYIDALPYGWDFDGVEPGWDTVGAVGIYMLETPQSNGPTASMKFTLEIDPSWDWQRYLTLKGFNYQTGESLGFMMGDTTPDDKRFLFATGPFDLAPGDTTYFSFAIVLAVDTISLAYTANAAKLFWEQQIEVEEETSHSLREQPITTITSGNMQIGKVDKVTIIDPMGRKIKTIKSPPRKIKLGFLPAGIYFVILERGDEFRKEKILIIR